MRTTKARTGTTYDQDRRGNVWQQEQRIIVTKDEGGLPAEVFIPFWIILCLGFAAFTAVQAGDGDLAGVTGDIAPSYGL